MLKCKRWFWWLSTQQARRAMNNTHTLMPPNMMNARGHWSSALIVLALLVGCAEDQTATEDSGTCAPDTRECLDDFNFRVCNPDGQGFSLGVCPADQPCVDGLCSAGGGGDTPDAGSNADGGPGNNEPGDPPDSGPDMPVDSSTEGPCDPFERLCVSPTLLKICRGDGSAYDLGTCSEQEPCEDGFCGGVQGQPGTCQPDVRECLDARTVRICNSQGTFWDNQVCPTGQLCQGGACRAQGDCIDNDNDGYGEGADCLGPDCNDDDFGISPDGFEVCDNGVDEDCDLGDAPCQCDPIAQDCPGDRLRCALGRGQDFECRPNGLLGEGEACGGVPSNCQRGLVCVTTNGEQRSTCTRMCDAGTGQGCLGEAECGATLVGFDDVGLCIGVDRCDPVDTPDSCPPGTTCQPTSDRDAICFEGGGQLGDDAACDPDNSQCRSGLACINVQGGDNPGNRCKAFCKVARGNADCANFRGEACQPLEFNFEYNGRNTVIRAYGACL